MYQPNTSLSPSRAHSKLACTLPCADCRVRARVRFSCSVKLCHYINNPLRNSRCSLKLSTCVFIVCTITSRFVSSQYGAVLDYCCTVHGVTGCGEEAGEKRGRPRGLLDEGAGRPQALPARKPAAVRRGLQRRFGRAGRCVSTWLFVVHLVVVVVSRVSRIIKITKLIF